MRARSVLLTGILSLNLGASKVPKASGSLVALSSYPNPLAAKVQALEEENKRLKEEIERLNKEKFEQAKEHGEKMIAHAMMIYAQLKQVDKVMSSKE